MTVAPPRPHTPHPTPETLDAPARAHLALVTTALVVGGFAIGTTEFVTMGLLPQIANGVHVSIPTAGHAISAYAVGVLLGTPVVAVLGARLPRRGLALALMAVFTLGSIASALASSYEWLVLARFLSGVPHGAFFGVSALIVSSLAAPGQKGRAVSRVMLGIPIANMAGVPAATWLGKTMGWRSAYWLVAAVAVLTVALVARWVPRTPGDRTASGRRELAAFRRAQVWLTLLIGAVGFGGMFAMYSYIAPTVTEVTGLGESAVPWFLLVFGIGGAVGSLVGGWLADWSVLRGLLIALVATGLLLATFTVTSQWAVPALLTVFAVSAAASVLVVVLQLRLMQVAGDAETIGAASNHAALNFANALGAWLGGAVIHAGWGYQAASWVGAALSMAGLAVLGLSLWLHRRTR
ncbi:MFS transporter [Ornithinicoccus hortensis]|uniref:DHA1 family inner membrane transport protein n=1 Tax=Ornithinicoccus hortensis TaxID=82346 RepID=A0A542YTL5_9MICO|nr:MFS transporter [Ornithinicoccus hortensis]TQL51429.1 DHA1 family inner membrane transport protein [Ornithinicoccus hortensis]